MKKTAVGCSSFLEKTVLQLVPIARPTVFIIRSNTVPKRTGIILTVVMNNIICISQHELFYFIIFEPVDVRIHGIFNLYPLERKILTKL